jgi:hypothetical protein
MLSSKKQQSEYNKTAAPSKSRFNHEKVFRNDHGFNDGLLQRPSFANMNLIQPADTTAKPVSALTFSGYAELYYVQDLDQPRRRNDPVFCTITSETGKSM